MIAQLDLPGLGQPILARCDPGRAGLEITTYFTKLFVFLFFCCQLPTPPGRPGPSRIETHRPGPGRAARLGGENEGFTTIKQ